MSRRETDKHIEHRTEFNKVTSSLHTPVGIELLIVVREVWKNLHSVYSLGSCACVMLYHFSSIFECGKDKKKQISGLCMYPEDAALCVSSVLKLNRGSAKQS